MRDAAIRRRTAMAAAASTIALAGAWLAPPGGAPAAAATTSVTVVSKTVTIPMGGRVNNTVLCPAGTKAINGGSSGSNPGAVMTSDSPFVDGQFLANHTNGTFANPTLSGWNASAADQGNLGNQTMTTYAICLKAGGLISTDLTVVIGSIAVPAGAFRSQSELCPAGTYALGGGADNDNTQKVDVLRSEPLLNNVPASSTANAVSGRRTAGRAGASTPTARSTS